MTKSEAIKNKLKKNKIPQWKLAQAAHVSEFTVNRWLREGELTKQREDILTAALRELELDNTLFNNTCPFYKPSDETSLEEIEKEIKKYGRL